MPSAPYHDLLASCLAALALLAGVAAAPAAPTAAAEPAAPLPHAETARQDDRSAQLLEDHPEEVRLSRSAFRGGLKQRGLTELLEVHLEAFPSGGSAESLLMMREVRMAEFADATQSPAARRAAVAEANRLLSKVIQTHRQDRRRFQWQFDLAHSLLYDQADPYLVGILYYGGSEAERRELGRLTGRALEVITTLAEALRKEYDRLDNLPVGSFSTLEASGVIERLDALDPRVHYLRLWALFYDSLARDGDDPTRARRLNRILSELADNPAMLETPHAVSGVQIQSLLLSGMASRQLNRHDAAREQLNRSQAMWHRLDDADEKSRLQWASTLAWLEAIRNEARDGRFDAALALLQQFRGTLAADRGDVFSLEMAAAMAERFIYRTWQAAATRDGDDAAAKRHRKSAWRVLWSLARRRPDHRDDLYRRVYRMIGRDARVEALDPIEHAALLAGLLYDAGQENNDDTGRSRGDGDGDAADGNLLLLRAIDVGDDFLAKSDPDAAILVAEVLYNMAVAEYRLGRVRQAAARFVAVARDHPDFDRAARAATFAVQLTAELQRDAVGQARPGNRPLYRTALELLVHRYADAEAARYWRFYLGQLLEESGDCEAAAREYSGVDASHELFLESRFAAARCMARVLQSMSDRDPPDRLGLQQRSGDFFAAASRCHELAGKVERDAPDPARLASLKRLTADLRVTTAEVLALPLIDRAADALEALLRFEEEFPQRPELIGRVWRVRVLAYERLQRLDEAARAIPEYVAADPAGAGATLQSLYVRLVADAARSRRTHDEPAARRKAEMALLLARQIDRWARRPASDVSFEGRRAAGVQLAEANLRAGRVERAGELFSQLRNDRTDAAPAETGDDLRIAVGFAEAAFQRGDFAGALPEFNRLATTLPPTDPVRWKSLLRDLQCRTRLGHPPRGIIRVIEQQRFLHHDLGGPEMAPRYEKLQRENQRRLDAG